MIHVAGQDLWQPQSKLEHHLEIDAPIGSRRREESS
jgi:hypothetical protein